MYTHTRFQDVTTYSLAPEVSEISEVSDVCYRFLLQTSGELVNQLQDVLNTAGLPKVDPARFLELANFSASPRMEDTLARWTQRISSQIEGFSIPFNNFGGIPSHTIYLRVQDASPLRQVVGDLRKLDMYLTGSGFQPLVSQSQFILPVVTDIPRHAYDNLMYRFGRVEFHASITIDALILQSKGRNGWQHAQTFPFAHKVSK